MGPGILGLGHCLSYSVLSSNLPHSCFIPLLWLLSDRHGQVKTMKFCLTEEKVRWVAPICCLLTPMAGLLTILPACMTAGAQGTRYLPLSCLSDPGTHQYPSPPTHDPLIIWPSPSLLRNTVGSSCLLLTAVTLQPSTQKIPSSPIFQHIHIQYTQHTHTSYIQHTQITHTT